MYGKYNIDKTVHTYTHTYMHACIQTYIHTYDVMYVCMYACMHAYTCIFIFTSFIYACTCSLGFWVSGQGFRSVDTYLYTHAYILNPKGPSTQ